MQVPLEISYRDVPKTEDLEAEIRRNVDKLEKVCDSIISCRVSLEQPQKHQRAGRAYRVRIDLRVPPNHEVVARREAGRGDMHDSLPVVLNDAFDAASRQLRDLVERRRGEIKLHPEQQPNAFVAKLIPGEGYGFLRALNGREVYFHKNSVLHHDFDRLEIGIGVHYTEEAGEQGPQASTVRVVDKPGARAPRTRAERREGEA